MNGARGGVGWELAEGEAVGRWFAGANVVWVGNGILGK